MPTTPAMNKASGKPPAQLSSVTLKATAKVRIEAAADGSDAKRPTFTISGYTGAVMSVAGFGVPVVVDLNGLKASRDRIPILLDHDSSKIIGQTDPDGITINGDGVTLSGTITGDDADAQKVVTHAKNGFEWQASIGAGVLRQEFLKTGEKTTVNGREVSGPLVIARDARLDETSFVAIGADNQTSATVAASQSLGSQKGAPTMFEQWLQAKGFTDPAALDDAQKASLEAMYNAEKAGPKVDPAKVKTLDEIFAEQKAEDERVEAITRLTASALHERPALSETLKRISAAAIAEKKSTQEYELVLLRLRASSPSGGFAIHSGDARASAKTIEATLCLSGGLANPEKHFDERTLNASYDQFPRGLKLGQALLIAAKENGFSGHDTSDIKAILRAAFPDDIRAQGWSTISLPNIFSNVANKFLTQGFNAVEDTWRMLSSKRNAPDFKAISTYALTGGFTFEKVGAGGELKHATVSELAYTNQVDTYGKMFAITRKDLINDDLGALTQVPKKLGRGGAVGLNQGFWSVFMNNSAFFTSGRANYSSGGGTALSLASLGAAQALFRSQTDPDGDPVQIEPRILLVPNALEVTAANLINSTQIANDTTANTMSFASNPFVNKYKVAQSAYLSNANYTGYSTTAWYLLADPEDMPVIEVAFLNGREMPVVESADADFNTLGIQFRGFFDWGVAMQEYRGGIKMAGA